MLLDAFTIHKDEDKRELIQRETVEMPLLSLKVMFQAMCYLTLSEVGLADEMLKRVPDFTFVGFFGHHGGLQRSRTRFSLVQRATNGCEGELSRSESS